jgi:hypothetical protein
MEGAGLRIVEWIDETEAMRAVFAQAGRDLQQTASSMIANQVILGDDFPERLKNAGRNVLERRLVLIFAVAERA